MSAFDLEELVKEISPDAPCGDDLEYDNEFGELERIAQEKPEQQIGDTIVPGEEPEWKQVQKISLGLFSRTKDLRVAFYLAQALLHTEGYTAFRDGLALFRTLLEQYWDTIHPQLDPDDDNDPTMRVNVLVSLCDEQSILRPLREAPLVSSRALGQFGLRQVAIASGELAPSASDESPPSMATIDGAFMDADLEELQATADAIAESVDHVQSIEAFVTDQVGAGNAQSMNVLVDTLKDAQKFLAEKLISRGVGAELPVEAEAAGGAEGATGGGAARAGAPVSGEVGSREDVVRVLDKIINYYQKYEPTSPVPILMERAKKLVHMSFFDVIRNVAPDAVSQIEVLRGPEDESEDSGGSSESSSDGW